MRILTLTICLLATLAVQAQTGSAERKYHDVKGFNFYFVFQPSYQNPGQLNDALSAAGAPEIRKLATANGGGIEYLFASGTGIRMELVSDYTTRRRNNAVSRLRPTTIDIGVRQMINPRQKLRPYLAAAFGAREAELQVIRNVNPGSSFASALGNANTTTLYSETVFVAGAVGINFQSLAGQSRNAADFSELELGYRYGLAAPEWRTEFVDAPALPGEAFRQFYISLKLGFQNRSKLRNR